MCKNYNDLHIVIQNTSSVKYLKDWITTNINEGLAMQQVHKAGESSPLL